jgi:hypothetical protein
MVSSTRNQNTKRRLRKNESLRWAVCPGIPVRNELDFQNTRTKAYSEVTSIEIHGTGPDIVRNAVVKYNPTMNWSEGIATIREEPSEPESVREPLVH